MSYNCRILAIDGGGIRGIIPAYILKDLEAALGRQTFQSFDVIAGTSTGGIISLALTPKRFLDPPAGPPYTAEQVLASISKTRRSCSSSSLRGTASRPSTTASSQAIRRPVSSPGCNRTFPVE